MLRHKSHLSGSNSFRVAFYSKELETLQLCLFFNFQLQAKAYCCAIVHKMKQ